MLEAALISSAHALRSVNAMLFNLCRLDDELQQQELLLASLRRANQQREDHLAYARRTLHEQTEERSAILEQQKRQLAALRDSLHTLKVSSNSLEHLCLLVPPGCQVAEYERTIQMCL